MDDYTVQSLLRHDPTPVASLPTSTKLIKALHLIQQAYQASHPENPSGVEPRLDVGVARAPDPFPLATYASLLELVGSALSDINQSPLTFTAMAGAASKSKKTVYELQLERARLFLDPSRQWTSPPTVLNGWGAVAPPSELSKEQKEDHDLANLYADNTRAALLILRPPILDPPPSDPSALSHAEPSSSADPFAAPTSFCPIASLPEELLSTIFSLARTAAEQRLEGAGLNGDGIYDEYGNPRSASAIQRRRMPGSLEGSRTAAQRFTLSLSLVCKDWRAPARRIAFRSLHCRKMGQMERLLKLLDDSPDGEELAGYISELNAKVLRASDLGMSVGRSRGYGRFVAAGGGGWGVASALGAGGSAAAAAALEKEEESPGFLFAQLVSKATNLRSLVLNLAGGSPYSIGFGAAGRQGVAEFLEPVSAACVTLHPRSLTGPPPAIACPQRPFLHPYP